MLPLRNKLSRRLHCFRNRNVFAAAALVSLLTSTALVGQVLEEEEGALPADESIESMSEEADIPRRDERPLRIRQEERNELEQLNDRQEEIGRNIERQREAAADAGEDIPFEVMKQRAEQELFEGAGPTDTTAPQLVCFRADGSVSGNREECDPDQGRHFGIQEGADDASDGTGSAGEYIQGYAPPSDDVLQDTLGERFQYTEPALAGEDLTAVVSNALDRLSAMITHMQGNPAAMTKIQETITFLSGILRQYGTGAEPPADIREQISTHLQEIMNAVHTANGPGGPDGFMPTDMSRILDMMEKMIGKLPRVIEIFEEEGIPVAPEARAAAEEAVSAFNRLKGPCADGDMNSCKQLGDIMKGIDQRMRPPMEKAMMEAQRPEVGMRIHELMSEGMEDMEDMNMRPDMPQGTGPNQGGMYEGYGPPPGIDPSHYEQGGQFNGPPPAGYGMPPEGGYGSPGL